MSDGLLRISEASALQVSDVEATADGGAVTIRASKTDQQGDGAVRFLGTPTVAAVRRYLDATGITGGPLFRRIRKGGRVTADRLGADSIRAIVRKRAAAVDGITGRIGGHSLRPSPPPARPPRGRTRTRPPFPTSAPRRRRPPPARSRQLASCPRFYRHRRDRPTTEGVQAEHGLRVDKQNTGREPCER